MMFGNPNVAVVSFEARDGCMTARKQLIKECLADLRQFFKFLQLHDGHDAGGSEILISLQHLAQIQKLQRPLPTSGFFESESTTFDSLDHKVVLALLVPIKKDVMEAETVHSLQLEVWTVTRVGKRVDHFGFAAAPFAFCQQWHARFQTQAEILQWPKLKDVARLTCHQVS